MGIFPTLMELCGLPTPAHNEGTSFAALLRNPTAAWDRPAVTTYRYKNHTIRNAGWRYIRYANGDEELYDETKDANEYVNLATKAEFDAKKTELAKFLPKTDVLDPSGNAPVTEEDAAAKAAKKAKRQKQKTQEK
jgi:arylsulfatase A-like enzyme